MDIISRKDWGARPAGSGRVTVAWRDRRGVAYHHSTGANLGREDCAAWLRAIQGYHMDTLGWRDIGYNLATCKHGDIFDLRGFTTLGAHIRGHNTPWVGVVYLGDARNADQFTAEGRRAMVEIGREVDRRAGRLTDRTWHGAIAATLCPGLIGPWVRDGMPLSGAGGGSGPSVPAGSIVLAGKSVLRSRATKPAAGSALERDTMACQSLLRHVHRLNPGPIDGWPGPSTAAAVRRLQERHRLTVDGVVGPQTWPVVLT